MKYHHYCVLVNGLNRERVQGMVRREILRLALWRCMKHPALATTCKHMKRLHLLHEKS